MARYIPILRWKRGERVALQRLDAVSRQDVVPLIVLAADQYAPTGPRGRPPTLTAAQAFVQQLSAAWGNRPFFLDASALGSNSGGNPAIRSIASRARAAGAMLIPATKLGAPARYQAEVDRIRGIDGRGIGLRIDLEELTSAAAWVATMPMPLNEVNLIADFSDEVAHVAALGGSVDHAFQNLHHGNQWRTVTMAGTSLPENFTGYPAGLHTIRRQEWALWQRLRRAVTAYQLDYGDYATVSPSAPPPGIAWGFPINVKYTIDNDFLIARGVKTTGPGALDMDVQLLSHAQSIRGYAARNPLLQCWADGKIDRIAALTETPGNLESWVQIGVNRHIALVRDRLP